MARTRSFTNYVADRFYNGLYKYVQTYVERIEVSDLNLRSCSVPDFDEAEFVDIEMK